ncbi:uncharacterized protein LOC113793421 [Dermatophagoides pteronyssinus]|uniref:Abscission/NoCut checkpoint regulator-like n=2 Tax=Dermatophagoides pteronyssinus TaxID=6956 RepID=A0A6P6Y165_DERPT|nr:abscission/NoCut checkpoint regulator-like [Dermatophagoides pteronyssinus]XP_027199256.1 abscission/NoCut checkpoint regulator-like [Dermatophagoides pteronyssinus]XP_027199257.1 abscission/NoCut checkpoint regulator-like [Dermatophagoides pteronyssinus]KAH9414103.1 Abscission/NoCut checkpoint regulator [Dermatophagoides pteronyssinus]
MDEEIEQRLRSLNETVNELARKNKSKELQKEIELRLAKLNERDPNFYSAQEPPVKLLSIKKNRTAVEEADDLLQQFMHEVSLDEKSKSSIISDEELKKLAKGQPELTLNKNRKNPMLKKFKQTGNLIHQLMMRRSLEIRERSLDDGNDDEIPDVIADDDEPLDEGINDDVDWCTTCNEDGVLRCIDCDMDIYCLDCFRELHHDHDMRDHRTQPYKSSQSDRCQKAS